MFNKIFFSLAVLILLAFGSGCQMRYQSGTTFKSWHPSGRFSRHWGRERHMNVKNMYWGHHRYGMRPHPYRGHFRD